NPALHKDLSLLVVDGETGIGNGRLIPAGPLREPAADGLARADCVVLMGPDSSGVGAALERAGTLPVLYARLRPEPGGAGIADRPVVAFAGIGRPDKFFAGLAELGVRF